MVGVCNCKCRRHVSSRGFEGLAFLGNFEKITPQRPNRMHFGKETGYSF